MVTYVVGTDGVEASETIRDHLLGEVAPGDTVEVLHVLSPGADYDERSGGEAALSVFEELAEGVTVETRQVSRGRGPAEELARFAEEVDADEIVVALRRHTRTERVIYGSVSHALLQKVTCPITLVPLPEYQPVAQ